MSPRPLYHHIFAWGLVLLYMGAIFYLSHQPTVPIPMRFPHQDKVVHFVAYFILGAFLAHALGGFGLTRKQRFFWAFLVGSLYGLSDEFHQSFVPGRDASLGDVLADGAGAWVGAYVYLLTEVRFFLGKKTRLKPGD